MKTLTSHLLFGVTIGAACLLLGVAAQSRTALAESHIFTASNEKWKAECSSCHVAYPPQLLPADSWRTIMAGLDKHFGADATQDDKSVKEISRFLEQHAGRDRQAAAGGPILRITETRWFRNEHSDVPEAAWKNTRVKSAANCAACHTRADSGDFAERSLNVPK